MAVTHPEVSGSLKTWHDLSTPAMATAVLRRVLQEGEPFDFDLMGHDEPLEIPFKRDEAVSLWCDNTATQEGLEVGWFIAQKKGPPGGSLMAHWQREPAGLWLNWVSVWAGEDYFRVDEHVERFLDLLVDLFRLVGAGYGDAFHSSERDTKGWIRQTLPNGKTQESTITLKAQDGLIDLWWGNLFGPPFVDLFTPERIESCPEVSVRKIDSKAYLLRTSKSPLEWASPSVHDIQERAKAHLN